MLDIGSGAQGSSMAKVTHVELTPDDPIYSEGPQVFGPAPRPTKASVPLGPPPTADEMAGQYSAQRSLEAALAKLWSGN